MKRVLPGINIQYPWSQLLLSGKKTVETRFYPIPKKYTNVPLALIETPGKSGNFQARVVGIIRFERCYKYESERAFRSDESRHLLKNGADFDWETGKEKWAWCVLEVKSLPTAIPAPKRRGIIWTSSVIF